MRVDLNLHLEPETPVHVTLHPDGIEMMDGQRTKPYGVVQVFNKFGDVNLYVQPDVARRLVEALTRVAEMPAPTIVDAPNVPTIEPFAPGEVPF